MTKIESTSTKLVIEIGANIIKKNTTKKGEIQIQTETKTERHRQRDRLRN